MPDGQGRHEVECTTAPFPASPSASPARAVAVASGPSVVGSGPSVRRQPSCPFGRSDNSRTSTVTLCNETSCCNSVAAESFAQWRIGLPGWYTHADLPKFCEQAEQVARSTLGHIPVGQMYYSKGYACCMAEVRKLSVSMPSDTVDMVRRTAEAENLSVSAWLTRAARMAADRHALLAAGREATAGLIAEHEAAHGSLPEASRERARAFLDEVADDERCRLDEAM